MTFIHPALLAGLTLAVIPVILHLVMRQRPKRLPFPAFRFLARKATTNRRKLRLRHLLLLLMRVLLISFMCLALARPRIISEHFSLLGDQPVAAVLVIDTSMSMGYIVADQSRLDEVKKRALELIDGLPTGSRLAILDPAEPGGEWLPSASMARDRVLSRELAAGAGPLTDSLAAAYRLFEEQQTKNADTGDVSPRYLYVFTDRTPACWDVSRTKDVVGLRDRAGEPKIQHVMIDVGVEKPVDLALTEVRLKPQVVPANKPVVMPVMVHATGQDVDTQLQCRIDGLPDVDVKPVKIKAGQTQQIEFRRSGLKPGVYRADIALATSDAVIQDNTQFVTFEVRTPRPVLVICDRTEDAKAIVAALKANYPSEAKTTADADLRTMAPADFNKYRAVCLMSVAAPGRAGLWDKLEEYVTQGGGVGIFPGGEEMIVHDYNQDGAARRLLPASFKQILSGNNDGEVWIEYQYSHPLIAPFREYKQMPESGFADHPPRTFKYWEVEPREKGLTLLRYGNKLRHPAILETGFDRSIVHGKLLLFTTRFDNWRDARDMPWNDYWPDWVYLALVNKTLQYLAGEAEDAEFNFVAGPPVSIVLPPGVRPAAFTLSGPGLSPSDTVVPRPDKATQLLLTKPQMPGHYTLSSPDRSWTASFSLNPSPAEFQLTPRVPLESLAELFPEDYIIAPTLGTPIVKNLDQRTRQPLELFPWLMLLLLILLAVENYFANRFYRREPATEDAAPGKLTT